MKNDHSHILLTENQYRILQLCKTLGSFRYDRIHALVYIICNQHFDKFKYNFCIIRGEVQSSELSQDLKTLLFYKFLIKDHDDFACSLKLNFYSLTIDNYVIEDSAFVKFKPLSDLTFHQIMVQALQLYRTNSLPMPIPRPTTGSLVRR